MKHRFVVLRDLAPSAPVTRSREGRGSAGPVHIGLEVVSADTREVQDLRREGRVQAVAPAMPMRLIRPCKVQPPTGRSPDPVAWGVRAVGADTSRWDGEGVVVAVLDTGIDAAHPAFKGARITSRDFTGEGEQDDDGHGTHCAATIFGRDVEGMRIGVAPGIRDVLIGKVLGQRGCTSEEIASAILWAADGHARIISMSLGMDFPGHVRSMVEEQGMPVELATSRALENYRANVMLFERLASMLRARQNPPLLIAAAGNESRFDLDPDFAIAVCPPAVSEGIVSVAAVGRGPQGLRIAGFSNTGATVSGPGVDILSAAPRGGCVEMSGTSMAAPHVAGVAALWAQKALAAGSAGLAGLRDRLVGRATTDGFAPEVDPIAVGAGLVRAPQE